MTNNLGLHHDRTSRLQQTLLDKSSIPKSLAHHLKSPVVNTKPKASTFFLTALLGWPRDSQIPLPHHHSTSDLQAQPLYFVSQCKQNSAYRLPNRRTVTCHYSQFPLRLNIVCCVWWLHIVWLGSVAKVSIFTATEHHGIKGEARHTLSVAVHEAVYHKFVLRNHHT